MKTPNGAIQQSQFVKVPETLADLRFANIRELASKLRFSPQEGRIWLGERRVVLMQVEAFAQLRNQLMTTLGPEETRGLLTRIGYDAGQRDADLARKLAGPAAPILDVLRAGGVLHALAGFVSPVRISQHGVTDGDPRSPDYYALGAWEDSVEDDAHIHAHGIGNHAVCWNAVGYISGYLTRCGGQQILARELECRAMGFPRCVMVAKPVANWADAEEDLSYMTSQARPARVFTGVTQTHERSTGPTTADAAAQPQPLAGDSAAMHILRHKIRRVASTEATVLLLGESGVGKSVTAREVHRQSRRSLKNFVEVNCAAIPEQLVESELFGVERGAFSGATSSRPGRFEAADGGTLFLDEIATLTMSAQGKLLRVLQTGELERLGSNKTVRTDVRVIVATNEDLRAAVRDGRFREDLFFRLNVFPIVIQPLRERRDDIALLAESMLTRFTSRHGRHVSGLTPNAMQALMHHHWPGNIRELENMLERGVIMAEDGEALDVHHLASVEDVLDAPGMLGVGGMGELTTAGDAAFSALDPARSTSQSDDTEGNPSEAGETAVAAGNDMQAYLQGLAQDMLHRGVAGLAPIEDALVRAALAETKGNITRAARLLGLTRAQMDYRVRKAAES